LNFNSFIFFDWFYKNSYVMIAIICKYRMVPFD